MPPIRLGIIGASATKGFARNAHIPAVKALPEFELTAVCTSTPETAKAAAAAYGAAHAFADYRQLIASPDVDAVVVAVRIPWHREMAVAAAEHGKHVYCEWPLAPTVEDGEAMAAVVERAGVVGQVGLQGRHAPWVQFLKELVADGGLGRIYTVNARLTGGHAYLRPGMGWAAKRAAGNHLVWIQVPHQLIMIQDIFGDITELSAQARTQYEWNLPDEPSPIDADAPDNASISAVLADGAALSAHFAYVPAQATGWRLEIYGERGTVVSAAAGMGHGSANTLHAALDGEREFRALPVPERFRVVPPEVPDTQALNVAQAYRRFAQAIAGEADASPSFADGVRMLRLLTAVLASSDDGGRRAVVG